MKKIILCFYLLIAANVFAQRNNSENDFKYEVMSHIKSQEFMFIDFGFGNIDYIGNHLNLGLNTRVMFHHFFAENISFDFTAKYRYLALDLNSNQINYSSSNDLSVPKGLELGVNGYYTFFTKEHNKDQRVVLRKAGNTSYVADLPARVYTNYSVKIGINRFDMPSHINFESNTSISTTPPQNQGYPVTGDLKYMQPVWTLNLGISRNLLSHSIYKTDSYGTVKYSNNVEFFVDALIGLGRRNPKELYFIRYDDVNNPNTQTSYTELTEADIDIIMSSIKYLPVGFQIGSRLSGLNAHAMSYSFLAGISPGYKADPGDNFQSRFFLTLSIAYRFTKMK
jgi:hypothetical protein